MTAGDARGFGAGGSAARVEWACGMALAAAFAWLWASAGRDAEHVTALNDFWGNAFAAEHLAWKASAVWNGFFPPGYPIVLAALPGARLVESAYYLNVAAGATLLLVVWWFARRVGGAGVGLASLVVVGCNPTVVDQILTTGADAGTVTLAATGALVLFDATQRRDASVWLAVMAGVLLGVAGWFRYHAFVFAGAALLAAALVGRRPSWRRVVVAGSCVLVFGLCLVALGLAAGDLAALSRAQAFNVYKGGVGSVDWFHLDSSALPTTFAEAIARDPDAFLHNYLVFSTPHVWLVVPTIVGALAAAGTARTFAVFSLVTTLVFLPIVNLGASPRGIAVVVPLVLVAAVLSAVNASARVFAPGLRRTAVVSAVCVIAAAGVWLAWVPQVRARIDGARALAGIYRDIGDRLRADHVAIGTQVFADSSFYFLDAPGWRVAAYHPRVLGGWPTLDLPGYLEAFPQPSTATLDAFLDDCQRLGVTHLLLTGAAGAVHPDLGRLFAGDHSTERVREVPAMPGVRIFRLVG